MRSVGLVAGGSPTLYIQTIIFPHSPFILMVVLGGRTSSLHVVYYYHWINGWNHVCLLYLLKYCNFVILEVTTTTTTVIKRPQILYMLILFNTQGYSIGQPFLYDVFTAVYSLIHYFTQPLHTETNMLQNSKICHKMLQETNLSRYAQYSSKVL